MTRKPDIDIQKLIRKKSYANDAFLRTHCSAFLRIISTCIGIDFRTSSFRRTQWILWLNYSNDVDLSVVTCTLFGCIFTISHIFKESWDFNYIQEKFQSAICSYSNTNGTGHNRAIHAHLILCLSFSIFFGIFIVSDAFVIYGYDDTKNENEAMYY